MSKEADQSHISEEQPDPMEAVFYTWKNTPTEAEDDKFAQLRSGSYKDFRNAHKQEIDLIWTISETSRAQLYAEAMETAGVESISELKEMGFKLEFEKVHQRSIQLHEQYQFPAIELMALLESQFVYSDDEVGTTNRPDTL